MTNKEKRIVATFVLLIVFAVISFIFPVSELQVPWNKEEKEKLRNTLFSSVSKANKKITKLDYDILFDSCMFKEVKRIYPTAELYQKNPEKLIVMLEDTSFILKMRGCLQEAHIKILKDTLALQRILAKYPIQNTLTPLTDSLKK